MSLELRSLLPYPNSCRGTNPHQQERDTKMAMLSFGGIDVSKDRLDVVVLPEEECSSVPNDAAGWVLIHDAQYTAEEYPVKVGWGHSTVEYVVNLGQFAQVKRVALTHHDPLRDDDAIDRLVANIRARLREAKPSFDVFPAVAGQTRAL